MSTCIYSRQTDSTAKFESAEHIIPKCIGGIQCLPKGWVSDEINNKFSALELNFARENPFVAIPRMFGPDIGRKHHSNRSKVGVFTERGDASELSLGYMKNTKPIHLNQIVFANLTEETPNENLSVKIIIAPSQEYTHEELITMFWTSVMQYNDCPSPIKSKDIPNHTYILGIQDRRWVLGVPIAVNPNDAKPLVRRAIEKITSHDIGEMINANGGIRTSSTQVTANFSIYFNQKDCFRAYAKIALNCLAFLKGQDYVLLPEFDNIRNSILIGENILDYVWISEAENVVIPFFMQYADKLPIGDRCHSVVIIKKDNVLYGAISLYGLGHSVMVKLSEKAERFTTDLFICDWQNHVEYKLIDCVLKICDYEEDD